MKKSSLSTVLLLSVAWFLSGLDVNAQQQKYALIIGVKSYRYVPPLQNSLNDALDMSATLKKKGFTVVELYDPPTKRAMQDGVMEYFKLLQGQPNGVGLVFYSGHGMQVKGVNYLIPTQANPQIEADLDDQCVNMDYVMRAIEQSGNGLNIFVLDACRNNPFKSFIRSGEKGLSMVETPKGSYIVYSTKPGSVASDGTGRNGLFTSKLLQYINTEGLNIEQVFKQVARDVSTASGDAQRPWIASDYTGDFYFTPASGSGGEAITKPQMSTATITKVPASRVENNFDTTVDYGYGATDARTVRVGTQEWLVKNLNVSNFANGDPIPEAKSQEEWARAGKNKQPAWCYFNNDPANGPKYGRLYNWYAVDDPRGLAPKGWHVPTDGEWDILINYLGGRDIAGSPMKNVQGWNGNGNGSNESGLEGLPSGYRSDFDGTFSNLGKYNKWWSSSEPTITTVEGAIGRGLRFDTNKITVIYYGDKKDGFSVRCIKDKN